MKSLIKIKYILLILLSSAAFASIVFFWVAKQSCRATTIRITIRAPMESRVQADAAITAHTVVLITCVTAPIRAPMESRVLAVAAITAPTVALITCVTPMAARRPAALGRTHGTAVAHVGPLPTCATREARQPTVTTAASA